MKICVLNDSHFGFGDVNWDSFNGLGELTIHSGRVSSLDEAVRRVGDAEIIVSDLPDLITANGIVNICPKIKYIAVTATGYDGVELEAARRHGVPISNVPSYGTASVAQYAIGLLLEVCGQTGYYSSYVHNGKWYVDSEDMVKNHRLIELDGKTMGVIGFGRIGQRVGKIAAALGMKVIAYNRSHSAEGAAIAEYVELDELYRRADVISLHCPATEATTGMINSASIAKMRDGVIIINNGRGALIRSADLAEALKSGKVYAAGLDVLEDEPLCGNNPLLTAPNCIITPHVSWLPRESRQRIIDQSAENVRAFLNGAPINVVN